MQWSLQFGIYPSPTLTMAIYQLELWHSSPKNATTLDYPSFLGWPLPGMWLRWWLGELNLWLYEPLVPALGGMWVLEWQVMRCFQVWCDMRPSHHCGQGWFGGPAARTTQWKNFVGVKKKLPAFWLTLHWWKLCQSPMNCRNHEHCNLHPLKSLGRPSKSNEQRIWLTLFQQPIVWGRLG